MKETVNIYKTTKGIFDLDDISEIVVSNRRLTTRLIRDDIKAAVNKIRLFRFGNPIVIDLQDLSTKGALISLNKKLSINKKLTLILEFENGKKFEIPAKIVRRGISDVYKYGIKFDKYNNELGDHLLETQTSLVFK